MGARSPGLSSVGIVRWREEHLKLLSGSLASARAGTPTVLSIEGEAGVGKSTLLRQLRSDATDFHVLAGEGDETTQAPLTLLRRWGALGEESAESAHFEPFQAAQSLRHYLDRLSSRGAVLIVLDDLQWIDPESIETVLWLMRRASGDRLLIAAASRPLRGAMQPLWQRFVRDAVDTTRLNLDGLDREQAIELIESLNSEIPVRLAERLWTHTAGNPLYIRSLVHEHSVDDLLAMDDLPAPVELAERMNQRISALRPESATLLRAISVLGSGWVSLPEAAALGGVLEPTTAVEVLIRERLLRRRSGEPGAPIRIFHDMVSTAIYQDIPLRERQKLHKRAAALLSSPADKLRHRFAATDRFDDALAIEIAQFATSLHGSGAFRSAAKYLRWASVVTGGSSLRESRWLDSLFESFLAKDIDVISEELSDVSWAQDEARRALVEGASLIPTGDWPEALRILEAISDETLASTDSLTRFRREALLAWIRVGTGADPEITRRGIANALAQDIQDPAVSGYLYLAQGQVTNDVDRADWELILVGDLPGNPMSVSMEDTFRLALRGTGRSIHFALDGGIADLDEVTRRLRGGVVDISNGAAHALLGFAHWLHGDWARASIAINLASESSFGLLDPIVQAVGPLRQVARGDTAGATEALAGAGSRLQRTPWPTALGVYITVAVARLHALGSNEEQAAFVRELRSAFGENAFELPLPRSSIWVLHGAFAAVWAGDTDLATRLRFQFEEADAALGWVRPSGFWIEGLVQEKLGNTDAALDLLTRAATIGIAQLPLYQAHLLVDAARVAARAGHQVGAANYRARALEIYVELGASVYNEKLAEPAVGPIRSVDDPMSLLSDRERDVVALLVDGLSYVQIANELYVTRSTVAFHLSRAYAKTNTTSRHELVAMVRARSVSA
jgi:DNA-binding CsgD family transcriptional regulator